MKTENIELAVVSDAEYLEPIGVLLHSNLRWLPPGALRIHWVHVRMDRHALRAAAELCRADPCPGDPGRMDEVSDLLKVVQVAPTSPVDYVPG